MLRKFSVLVLFIILGVVSNAQLTKGNWLVGGSGSYISNKYSTTDQKTKKITVAPNIGYFLLDKLPVGIKANYSLNKVINPNGTNAKDESFVVGPFCRYYFLKEDKLVNFFVEGNYAFGFYNITAGGSFKDGSVRNYSILAGPVIYFNSNVGLEFTIGYYDNKYIQPNITNSGMSINVGLQIHLEKNN